MTVVDAPRMLEGAGFEVCRAFAGVDLRLVDPFILLDHMGAVEYSPGEAKGAPDHLHRGFETVTYMMDGELEHRDSNGGGGLITDGATQQMTAGSGIVHSEMPTEQIVAKGELSVRRKSRVAVVIGCGCVVDGRLSSWSDHVASDDNTPEHRRALARRL